MSNKFYEPGQSRAAKVHDLFSAIARRYDLINDLQSLGMHRQWKNRLIQLSRLQPGELALDVCCGTGDIAVRLSRGGARTFGVDFSDSMLDIARARSRGLANPISFMQGDAMRLPFPNLTFDLVTVGYGLRNLANIEDGLREMLRVLKPRGRLLILDFGKPKNTLLRFAYINYLKLWVPLFGKLFCGDSATYSYILESLKHYPGQEGVAALMHKADCCNVTICDLLGGIMSINHCEKAAEQSSG
jgi:demethylmenaquinone methyltransferase / 2-methoxy-6-polyprenyl-1,4-benzoquinol methylase